MPFTSTTTLFGYNSYSSLDVEMFFLRAYQMFSNLDESDVDTAIETAQTVWFYFQLVSYSLTTLLVFGIVYCIIGIQRVRKEEAEYYGAPKQEEPVLAAPPRQNEKWQRILEYSRSENPNDWRVAVLEADILLEELVGLVGYRGETLSDKLKQIERSDFHTLEQAWEAHKVRNQIAHAGSDYILTPREARRVVDLYRQVFEEFHFI